MSRGFHWSAALKEWPLHQRAPRFYSINEFSVFQNTDGAACFPAAAGVSFSEPAYSKAWALQKLGAKRT
jgi:hypothetical protein